MDKSHEETARMIHRIKTSSDGLEFVEYLEQLSSDNYAAFKRCHIDANEFHKGYAFAIDNMISIFEECDIEIEKKEEEVKDWTN